jgi:acyl-CoA oxidase
MSTELSVADIMNLTDKFWDLHSDPILSHDGAAATLITIHYNLVAGTLAQYLPERNDLAGILEDILQWRKQ